MTVFNIWPIERVVLFGVYLRQRAFVPRAANSRRNKKKERQREREDSRRLSSYEDPFLSSRRGF